MEFDEQAAIDYIRSHMPAASLDKVDDDEILNLIDIVWDYYDEHGLLDVNLDDDDDDDAVDIGDMVKYVSKVIAKDKNSPITPDLVEDMVKLEIEYEDSIEDEI